MNRVSTIDSITTAFSQLESYLKLNSGQNFNTAAGLAEDFCVPLLKLVYGYDLINANAEAKSAAGIDLLDRTRRLAVQVTVNDTTEKIRDTHRTVPGSKFAAQFNKVIILFLVRKAPPEPEASSKFTPCTSHTITPLDLDGILSAIRRLGPSVQEVITAFLEEEWGKPRWHQDTRISNLPFDSLGDLFIGREAFMGDLAKSLGHAGPTVIKSVQAIHGMGGVGKTRAAIEYGWRHAAESHALLFVQADSPDALRRNLAALCAPAILDLPEHAATETDTQVAAVLDWLRKTPGWLLILDNVDSPETQTLVKEITAPLLHGQLLITSRLATWPVGFDALDLDVLSPQDSVKLLLDHTAGLRIEEPDEAAAAAEIARLVDGLALALEQAAAHIRRTRCSFAAYLVKWRASDARLRDYQDRGVADYHAPPPGQHPEEALPRSLWVTFDASFRLLAPEARHLLQLLAWLAPDPMPVAHLETLAAIPAATDLLCDLDDLHLVRYPGDNRAFAVHRLIQEIVRREQTDPKPPPLLEALEWVNGLYQGDPGDVRLWGLLAPLTPHAVSVATYAADHDIPEPTARLINDAAGLLHARADHCAAEPLMRRALAILEGSVGENHPNVAACLNSLARLLQDTNRLFEPEPLLRRALVILESSLDENHPNVAASLNNLAIVLCATNRLAEAEPLMRRALVIVEASSGPDHPTAATYLNSLATLLRETNRFPEAERLMRRALAIDEASYGPEHPKVAIVLDNLATLLRGSNRPSEAETLQRRALAILESCLGECHPSVAISLNNLASLLQATDRLAEAEPLMRRALDIDEGSFSPDHPAIARDLNNLAQLLLATDRHTEAETLMRRAHAILEGSLVQTHPDVISSISNLAHLLQATNRHAEAEPMMRRALEVVEESFGKDHPQVAIRLNNLAALHLATDRLAEAEPLMRRHLEIFLKFTADTGHPHPHLNGALDNYHQILTAMGDTDEQALAKITALLAEYGLQESTKS
jgi:tetratricopeptide (TPR) repeat protein